MKQIFLVSLSILLATFLCSEKGLSCPSKEAVQAGLLKVNPRYKLIHVEAVKPSSIPGFCEVIINFAGRKNVFFVDQKGRYAFLGQLLDLKKGENLTRQLVMDLNRLKPADLLALDSVVAFTAGKGTKTVYFVTDPNCPFCKKMEGVLSSLIEEGKITVKVILYPLEKLHPSSKKEAVAIICDQKGWDGLVNAYISENQCKEGQEKVAAAQRVLRQFHVRGTPVLILSDGRMVQGARSKTEIEKILGL